MINFIVRIVISGVIAFALSKILTGIKIDNIGIAIIFALVLAFLNAIVKPILILLTLPITVVTLGLFLLVINAAMIILAAKLIDGIKVSSFGWALLFSIILSIFNSAAQNALEKKES
jgi:putative membrane protein